MAPKKISRPSETKPLKRKGKSLMGVSRLFETNWKPGDFFIQLATVIIGIIVTFGGSALIQRGGQKKEARLLLEMVREELKGNIDVSDRYREWCEWQYYGAKAFLPYLNKPQEVPIDTLNKYYNFLGNVEFATPFTNAFEIMKASPAIHRIDNSLMLDITDTYEMMDDNATYFKAIVDDKLSIVEDYNNSRTRDEVIREYIDGFDPKMYFAHWTTNSRLVQYTINSTYESNWLYGMMMSQPEIQKELNGMVEKIDNYLNENY